MDIKRQTLADQLKALREEYLAASAQLARTLSDVDRVRLQRQLSDLEERITATEAEITALDRSPEVANEPNGGDPPTPPVPVPDPPQKPSRKVPIWIWYFVVVLLGFVLGVVTDLVQLLNLSSCTGLWLAAALALISGVAILGFSWLPEQRSLHLRRDRIILVGLTLVCTMGLAAYALAICSPPESVVMALETSHGTNVTTLNAEDDWKLWGWTDYRDVTDPEKFTLMCIDGEKAAMLTYYDRYVTAMNWQRDWLLRAGRPVVESRGESELFILLDPQTERTLSCPRVVGQLEQNERVSLLLQTAHDRYVTAKYGKEDGDWRIWADEPGPIRDEQIFTLIKQN